MHLERMAVLQSKNAVPSSRTGAGGGGDPCAGESPDEGVWDFHGEYAGGGIVTGGSVGRHSMNYKLRITNFADGVYAAPPSLSFRGLAIRTGGHSRMNERCTDHGPLVKGGSP